MIKRPDLSEAHPSKSEIATLGPLAAPLSAPPPKPEIAIKIGRFCHFDQSWRKAIVRDFLIGDPVDRLIERRPGSERPGDRPSHGLMTLVQVFAVVYAYRYKRGYGPLRPEDVDALVEMLGPSAARSLALWEAEHGDVWDLSDVHRLQEQFRAELIRTAHEAERVPPTVVPSEAFRIARDAELDNRLRARSPAVKRSPGRPPEPEEVRQAKARARLEAKERDREAKIRAAEEVRKAREAAKLKRAQERAREGEIVALKARLHSLETRAADLNLQTKDVQSLITTTKERLQQLEPGAAPDA